MPTSRWWLLSGTAPVNRHFHQPRKFYGTELMRGNAFQAEGKGPGKDTSHRATGGCNTHRTEARPTAESQTNHRRSASEYGFEGPEPPRPQTQTPLQGSLDAPQVVLTLSLDYPQSPKPPRTSSSSLRRRPPLQVSASQFC